MSGNIKTLEDSINYFGLRPVLENLENSLECLRRNRKTVGEHEACVRAADKEMRKMCLSFHPDRIRNGGSSEEELSVAEELQTALNTTRTALNTIGEEFLGELHIWYKYEFFMDMGLNSLGSEVPIRNRMTEVSCKIRIFSEIKRENIVAPTRKFLTSSQSCVENYINSEADDYERNHGLATFYLKRCVEGHEALKAEFVDVERKCNEEGLESMGQSIRRMRRRCFTQLCILEMLKDEHSVDRTMQVFRNFNLMDEHFVLPFAYYVNILGMCSAMLQMKMKELGKTPRKYFFNLQLPKFQLCAPESPRQNVNNIATKQAPREVGLLKSMYYLTSYVEDGTWYRKEVEEIVGIGNTEISTQNATVKFNHILIEIVDLLKEEFKEDVFKVISAKENMLKNLAKLNSRHESDYEELSEAFAKHMEEFQKDNEKRIEERQMIMEQNEKIRRKLAKCSMFMDEVLGDDFKE